MKDWYVGQKVVCVENEIVWGQGLDPWYENFKIPLVKNQIYTIREILFTTSRQISFRLVGVKCISTLTKIEYNWADIRFRPLEEKEIDISVFHSILDKINNTVEMPILEEIKC